MQSVKQTIAGSVMVLLAIAFVARVTLYANPLSAGSSFDASDGLATTRPEAPRKPLSSYTSGLNPSVFNSSVSKIESHPPRSTVAARVSQGLGQTPVSNTENADAPHYMLTGIVSLHGRTAALIENIRTRQGIFLHIGDRFHQAKVIGIGPNRVTLAYKGSRRYVDRLENYRLTPLSSSAPFMAAKRLAPPTGGSLPSPSIVVIEVAAPTNETPDDLNAGADNAIQAIPQPYPVAIPVPVSDYPPSDYSITPFPDPAWLSQQGDFGAP